MSSVEIWVPAIALLAALAFIFQIVAVILTARSVRQVTAQIERQSKDLEGTLSQVQSRLLEVSESLEPVRAVAQDLATNLGNMSETLRNRAEHADAVIKDLMTVGRIRRRRLTFWSVIRWRSSNRQQRRFRRTCSSRHRDLFFHPRNQEWN